MNKTTGGPAFPTGTWEYDGQNNVLPYQEPGMSLRDYFAAKAMQVNLYQCDYFPDENWRMGVALDSYKMADAMLKAREQ